MTWFLARFALVLWYAAMFYVLINAPVSFFLFGDTNLSNS